MDNTVKIILVALVILYVVSPLDFAPGPIDDILVVLLGMAAQKGITVS